MEQISGRTDPTRSETWFEGITPDFLECGQLELDAESFEPAEPIRDQEDLWAATDPKTFPPSALRGARGSPGRGDAGPRVGPETARPASNPRLSQARSLTPAVSLPPEAATDGSLERELRDRIAACEGSDHFARLELPRTATTEQVRQRFIDLIKRYHPDRVAGRQKQLLPLANALYFRLKESYDVLIDPPSRARYCKTLGKSEGGGRSLDEARAAWLRGRDLLARKDFAQAELELRAAVRSDPQADYLAELAWALFVNPARREESRCEIRELLARAIQLEYRTDRVFTVAGHFERWQQNAKRAENLFRTALYLNPQNREAAAQVRLFELRRRRSPTWRWRDLLRMPLRFFGRN